MFSNSDAEKITTGARRTRRKGEEKSRERAGCQRPELSEEQFRLLSFSSFLRVLRASVVSRSNQRFKRLRPDHDDRERMQPGIGVTPYLLGQAELLDTQPIEQ